MCDRPTGQVVPVRSFKVAFHDDQLPVTNFFAPTDLVPVAMNRQSPWCGVLGLLYFQI